MNVTRDPDAILAAWLEEGPTGLPEPTRRAIAVNTRMTTQRRQPIWLPLRRPLMNTYARWAVAAIAIVLVAGGAMYFLAPAGGGIGRPPTASPTPTASPSPSPTATLQATASPSPSPAALANQGFVYPGAYVPRFAPAMTFTIDHEVEHNCAPGFRCRGSIDANLPGWVDLEFGLPRIEVGVTRIDKVNDPAHPGRLIDPPSDLGAWLASRPGLTVTGQTSTTVGGLAGIRLDVRIGSKDVSIGPIPGVTDPGLGFGANSVSRLYLVVVHGKQILIGLHAEDGSIDELQPLVDSIVWN